MIPQLSHLNRHERKQAILFMERENAKWPAELTPVPEESWPPSYPGHHRPVGLWRSREFVVQVFQEHGDILRMSVNRTHVDPASLRWVDGITFDELQALKRQAGFGDRFAVEVYPADVDIVNVGSLRHLWILPGRLDVSRGKEMSDGRIREDDQEWAEKVAASEYKQRTAAEQDETLPRIGEQGPTRDASSPLAPAAATPAAPTPRTDAYLRNIYNPASRKFNHPTAIPRSVAEAGIKLLKELECELTAAKAELQAARRDAETIRNDTLEEAAKVCDEHPGNRVSNNWSSVGVLRDCVHRIRAMKRTSAQVPVRPVGRS